MEGYDKIKERAEVLHISTIGGWRRFRDTTELFQKVSDCFNKGRIIRGIVVRCSVNRFSIQCHSAWSDIPYVTSKHGNLLSKLISQP